MSSSSFVAPCWCPSGCQGNYSDQYRNLCRDDGSKSSGEFAPFPCCGDQLAKVWQSERRECLDGDIGECCCNGLCLRVGRSLTSAIDIAVGAVASPIFCLGGPVISCVSGCVGGCLCGIALASTCCLEENSNWTKKVKSKGESALNLAINTCANSMKFTGVCFGNSVTSLVRWPFNLVCPELCELCGWQEELNLKMNQWMKCVDYSKKCKTSSTPQ